MSEQLASNKEEPEGRKSERVIYLDERRESRSGTLRPPPIAPANDIIGSFEVEFINSLDPILANLKNLFEEYRSLTEPEEIDGYRYAFYLAWKDVSLKNFPAEEVNRFSRYDKVQKKWQEQIRSLFDQITDWHHKISEIRRDLRDKKLQDSDGLKAKVEQYLTNLDNDAIKLVNERLSEDNLELIAKFIAVNLKEA